MNDQRRYAVLFDLDGTLIDSIGLLLASVKHTFSGREGSAPTEEEWIAGIGTPLAAQLKPYVESDEDAQELVARYRTFQREHHDRFTAPYDGVMDTLEQLYNWGHPLGVVTSKSNEMMERGLRQTGMDVYMKTMIGCDSCARHKPDPFPVQMALDELGYQAHETVFVGDSPHDIASGNGAGVTTIAALWGPFTKSQLAPFKPTLYLENITDLPRTVQRLQAGAIAGRTPRDGTQVERPE
ncbi:MAG: HAD family hydrolase [Gemmatimonadaceae bacterium]